MCARRYKKSGAQQAVKQVIQQAHAQAQQRATLPPPLHTLTSPTPTPTAVTQQRATLPPLHTLTSPTPVTQQRATLPHTLTIPTPTAVTPLPVVTQTPVTQLPATQTAVTAAAGVLIHQAPPQSAAGVGGGLAGAHHVTIAGAQVQVTRAPQVVTGAQAGGGDKGTYTMRLRSPNKP